MKSQILKSIISVAALVFVFSGVSFAHDWNKRHHKRHGKAYGHHKAEKDLPKWSRKLIKFIRQHQKQNRKHEHRIYQKNHHAGYFCKDGFYHYYDKRDRRWRIDQHKPRPHQRDKYGYKRSHLQNKKPYRNRAQRKDVVFKVSVKNPRPGVTVLKDGRLMYQ